MKNNTKYYTSLCTLYYLASCLVFIGTILLLYVGNGPVMDGAMIIFQSIFLSIQAGYIIWGTGDRKGGKLTCIIIILLIITILYFINPEAKETAVLVTTMSTIIYYLICYTTGKMIGDNMAGKGDIVNYLYFSYINEKMAGMKVIFPLDIGGGRNGMKEGTVKKAGKMLSGKYVDQIVFLLMREDRYYICPVNKVYPLEISENNGDNIIARTKDMEIKAWKFEKGRCKGYFSVIAY
jgi:hypothetical protein